MTQVESVKSSWPTQASWLAFMISGFLIMSLAVTFRPTPNVIDKALPFVGFCLAGVLWLLHRAPFVPLFTVTVPLLAFGALAIPQLPLRLAFYGIVFSLTVTIVLALAHSEGLVTRWRGALLLLLILAPARLIGLDATDLPGAALVLVGAVCLLFTLAKENRVDPVAMILAAAIGLATPVTPFRAALFPLVVTAAVHMLRSPRVVTIIPAALVMILAGRWGLLIGVIVLLCSFAPRWRASRARSQTGAPLVVTSSSALVSFLSPFRPLLFAPEVLVKGIRAGLSAQLSVGALLVAALVLRPQLTVFFALTAACLAYSVVDETKRQAVLSPIALVLTMLMAMLWPWSGIIPASFPLPLAFTSLVALIFLASFTQWLGSGRVVIVAGSAILFVFMAIWSVDQMQRERQTIGFALAAGESDNIRPDRRGRRVSVIFSGAHTSGLGANHVLGAIDAITVRGQVFRRSVYVREAADWAAMRPDQSFRTRNPIPLDPSGDIQGLGASAWLTGKGRITMRLDDKVAMLRVTAGRELPKAARLQVEAIEVSD